MVTGKWIIHANLRARLAAKHHLRRRPDSATMVQGAGMSARIMQVSVYFKELAKWVFQ
jgi:hypothetical protein